MSMRGAAGGRVPLFGESSSGAEGSRQRQEEVGAWREAREREEDEELGLLGDRVGRLKGITGEIHSEVEGQNRYLDGFEAALGATHSGIGNIAERFKTVVKTRENARLALVALAFCVLLVLFRVLF